MLPDFEFSPAESGECLVRIRGIVQGVGFRPFILRLAEMHGLNGWVRNDSDGVTIRLLASRQQLDRFVEAIQSSPPPASRIDELNAERLEPNRSPDLPPCPEGFVIIESPAVKQKPLAGVTPDLGLCEDCRRELIDTRDRRYHYPFINCTNCGPRYSIVNQLPYDRERTSMKAFTMCPVCLAEYQDPRNRRFHAQPNACPTCGPHIRLLDSNGNPTAEGDAALCKATGALQSGAIVAVKGIGGFHLLVDALNESAVNKLRERKHRDQKPLAVMFRDMDQLRGVAMVTQKEESLLFSSAAPIVLVNKLHSCPLASSVAPGNPLIGALMPYSPLHVLIMEMVARPLVATSANLSEEPLCSDNHEAVERLRGIADWYLVHNRPIARAIDDSVQRVSAVGPILLRRARGYAPASLALPTGTCSEHPILSVGGHMKNTIAVTMNNQVILSPHIGDLANASSVAAFKNTIELLSDLYGGEIQQVTCDLHPDYSSTRYAESIGVPVVRVQHHLAHVLACLLEHNGGPGKVLGVSWDGTGYGEDGTIWGGEFILVDRKLRLSQRVAHFKPFRLPGGEAAVRQTSRCLLGAFYSSGLDQSSVCAARLRQALGKDWAHLDTLMTLCDRELNAPLTSSAGRLFDAVAALLGICDYNRFEGQAGMAVEFAAARSGNAIADFSYELTPSQNGKGELEVDWSPLLEQMAAAATSGIAVPTLAMGFHRTLANIIVDVARHFGIKSVVLTGGCFQNAILTELTHQALREARFNVLLHRHLPPNDNAIAAGQALAAVWGMGSP